MPLIKMPKITTNEITTNEITTNGLRHCGSMSQQEFPEMKITQNSTNFAPFITAKNYETIKMHITLSRAFQQYQNQI
jgi:hypothetical protein